MTELTRERLADRTAAIIDATIAINRALQDCGLSVPEAHVACLLVARLMREGVSSVERSDHGAIAEFIEHEAASYRETNAELTS